MIGKVWMSVFHKLGYLDTWRPVGGIIWGRVGLGGGAALLEDLRHRDWALRVAPLPSSLRPLLRACGKRCDLSASCSKLLPCRQTAATRPAVMHSYLSGSVNQINTYIIFVHGVLS